MTAIEPLPAAACAGGRSLSEPRLAPGGGLVAFVVRDRDGARVVAAAADGSGAERVLATDPEPAGRGGVLAWLDQDRLAYVTKEGDVAVAGGGALVTGVEGGASALAASADGRRLAFVADTRSICVAKAGGGEALEIVSATADFALDPAWTPDGTRLAWQEWDVPNMPWDGSRIVAGPGKEVAGGANVAAQEPRWAPDGSALAYLCDAGGWLNLWVAGAHGANARPLVNEALEHGGPVWGGGSRSFAWSPESTALAFTRNEGGFGRLCIVEVGTGQVRELAKGVHTSLTWEGDRIACLRTGARTPAAVVSYEARTGRRTVVASGVTPALEVAAGWMPEPEPVEWRNSVGQTVHGRLWRPPGAGATPPPLLVWNHGGPTDQRQVTFEPRLAYYLSRGWAVLHPDPRGSTGWGRAWAQALRRGWGEADVDDVAAGACAAVDQGWADPSRLVATGTSAGGMTSLLLAARDPHLWAAAVALYPVVDLLGLVAATHRFEAHYTDHLVGRLPEATELYRARSPITVAGRIRCPVLLLHGSADVVVPPQQSAQLATALSDNGTPVEHHVYEGEGHGWKSPATTTDELERTDEFLRLHVLK